MAPVIYCRLEIGNCSEPDFFLPEPEGINATNFETPEADNILPTHQFNDSDKSLVEVENRLSQGNDMTLSMQAVTELMKNGLVDSIEFMNSEDMP